MKIFNFEVRRLDVDHAQRVPEQPLLVDTFRDSLALMLIALAGDSRTRRTMERQWHMSQGRWNEAYRTLKRAGVIDVGGQLTGMDCYQLTRLLVQREEEHRRVSVHGNYVAP